MLTIGILKNCFSVSVVMQHPHQKQPEEGRAYLILPLVHCIGDRVDTWKQEPWREAAYWRADDGFLSLLF